MTAWPSGPHREWWARPSVLLSLHLHVYFWMPATLGLVRCLQRRPGEGLFGNRKVASTRQLKQIKGRNHHQGHTQKQAEHPALPAVCQHSPLVFFCFSLYSSESFNPRVPCLPPRGRPPWLEFFDVQLQSTAVLLLLPHFLQPSSYAFARTLKNSRKSCAWPLLFFKMQASDNAILRNIDALEWVRKR